MRNMFIVNNMALLLFLSLTISCEKNEKAVIQGRVVNTGTKEPIDNVWVVIKDGVNISSDGFNFDIGETSSGKKNIAYTNKEGEFTVEISGEHQAWLGVSKDGYSFYKSDRQNVTGALLSFPYGINSGVVIEMKADAKFEGFFKTLLPVNSTDTLIVYALFYDNIKYYDWYRMFVGQQISNWDRPYPAIGDKYLRLQLNFQRNNSWHTVIDSVYIKSFEKYTDTIYY